MAVVVHGDFNVVVSVLWVHTKLGSTGEVCIHGEGLDGNR